MAQHADVIGSVSARDQAGDLHRCATALRSLGLLEPRSAITVSKARLGSGSVRTAHGMLPVPVPAVVKLLTDAGASASAG